ncbi:hypothetical protein I3760_01G072600 [Carya illinoinensis]|nr:hypothetical protein I3760_01G072600 [Carya illinoinensis]
MLSQAGRTMLIRSVGRSIPTYQMSIHMFPKSICKTLNSSFRDFWWGKSNEQRHKLYMKSWKTICQPKKDGGLGLRLMENMNMALIAKTGWEMSKSQSNSIWQHLLSKKYLKSSVFETTISKATDSPFWKGLLTTRPLLKKGTCFKITNGLSVKVWSDPWIPTLEGFKPFPLDHTIDHSNNMKVSELISQSNGSWNIPILVSLFQQDSINEILKIPLPLSNQSSDKLV